MAFPLIAAVLGASVIGAGASIIGGNKAAKAQKQAADASVAESRRQYDQSRADMAPWLQTGGGALALLARLYGIAPPDGFPAGANDNQPYGGFFTSPGYQFRLNQGVQAVERSAAARGLLRSGAAAKAIQRYGEGLAASEYDSYANRLAQIAGFGQNAANTNAATGATATNNITQALMASGNARASSYANTASSINTGLNNILSAYLYRAGGGFGGGTGAGGSAGRGGW
jgi:hypothetical protein